MHHYRITKYNPDYRDQNGVYCYDDWSSISEIGKNFNGRKLTFENYTRIENAYVSAIIRIMDANKVTFLKIAGVEQKYINSYPDMKEYDILKFIDELNEGVYIEKQKIELISKLILREMIWGKLINNKTLYVHFGYDYYMYIGSKKKLYDEISAIQRDGLFVEEFVSPYL